MISNDEMQEVIDTSDRLVEATKLDFHRYLSAEIDWRDRLICIKGARGTGKTTMMRQRIKEAFGAGGKAAYLSLDDLWFATHRVRDAIEYLSSHGYTHVFLDEVHHFGADWSLLIKNLYDQFPDLSFVYSGSSLLKLESSKGDLSRRQAVYTLKGLSFREYLAFESVGTFAVLSFEEILANHRQLASRIVEKIKILPHFEAYLKKGYYPFYKESHALYEQRIVEVVNKVLESDWPAVENVTAESAFQVVKLGGQYTDSTVTQDYIGPQLQLTEGFNFEQKAGAIALSGAIAVDTVYGRTDVFVEVSVAETRELVYTGRVGFGGTSIRIEKSGKYSVRYYSNDNRFNSTYLDYTLSVYSDVEFNVRLNGEMPERVGLGETVYLPPFGVDGVDGYQAVVYVVLPKGGLIDVTETLSFQATQVGSYKVVYYVVYEVENSYLYDLVEYIVEVR